MLTSWLIGSILMGLGTLIAASSWVRLYHNATHQTEECKPHASPIPLVGSLLFFLGYGLVPIEHHYGALLFLLFDFDTLCALIALPYAWWMQRQESKP